MSLESGWKATDDRRVAGMVLRDGAEAWVCPHNHASTDLAEQCARRKVTEIRQVEGENTPAG